MIYSVVKSKTGTCLLIAFSFFLNNIHGINAKSVPVASFEIEDPKVLKNVESVTDEKKINTDAKVQNQKSTVNAKIHVLQKRQTLNTIPQYMKPCHFKICNIGSGTIADSKESEQKESVTDQKLTNQTRIETILPKQSFALKEGKHVLRKRVTSSFSDKAKLYDYMHPCHFKICNMGR